MVTENGMVMMSETEYDDNQKRIEYLTNEVRELRKALILATRKKKEKTKDVKVSMATFYNIAQEIFKYEDGDVIDMEKDIYGHDITVHFHGLYCNCYDGAPAFNNIIEAVGGCSEEYDDEDIYVEEKEN